MWDHAGRLVILGLWKINCQVIFPDGFGKETCFSLFCNDRTDSLSVNNSYEDSEGVTVQFRSRNVHL